MVKRKVNRKRKVRRVSKKSVSVARPIRSSGKKLRLSIKNLIVFAILSVVSYVLMGNVASEKFADMFFILSVIFGVIALTFLIVLLILLLLRVFRR